MNNMIKVGLLVILASAVLIQGSTFKVHVGQSDSGFSSLFFYPNLITIAKSDDINFVWEGMAHTVTFFENQTSAFDLQTYFLLPPAFDLKISSVVSPTTLYSTGILEKGANYTFKFPVAGNFSFHCAIHTGQVGLVTVIDSTPALDPTAVEAVAQQQIAQFKQSLPPLKTSQNLTRTTPEQISSNKYRVLAGGGAASKFLVAYMGFTPANFTVKVGDTVSFEVIDPVDAHEVAFNDSGVFDSRPTAFANGTVQLNTNYVLPGGTPSNYNGGFVSSGLLFNPDLGLPAPGKWEITFTKEGVYPYICDIHLNEGMRGWVTVTSSSSVVAVSAGFIAVIALLALML